MDVKRFLLGWLGGTGAVLWILHQRVEIAPEDMTTIVVGSVALMFMAALPLATRR